MHGKFIILGSLPQAVQGRAGEQFRAAHHPVEMFYRYGLALRNSMHIDVSGQAM